MSGARRYEDLEVWQLADELKREVYALVRTGPAARDFKFRDQIRDSSASSTKNIAEGFGRFHPGEFARFMEFAVASAMETKDSLKDGLDRGYFIPERVPLPSVWPNAPSGARRDSSCISRPRRHAAGDRSGRADRERRTSNEDSRAAER
jgi:four helix bundle protein